LKMNWIFADSYLNPIDENIDGKFWFKYNQRSHYFSSSIHKNSEKELPPFFCHLLKQTMALFNDDTWSFYVSSNFWLLYLLIGLQVLWFDETTF
jgi:hypothetical protein